MKITIDTDKRTLVCEGPSGTETYDLYSEKAFDVVARQWLKIGWNQKYSYSFSWLGRPVIQLPEDMVRAQEAIYALRPDVIIETGVAHGGSLVFYASLLKLIGKGRVIGVDIEIRPHNRAKIEAHELSSLITLIESDSVGGEAIGRVGENIKPGERVMVILDSCHTKSHVLKELEAYGKFVTPGSYIVATDGIMNDLYDVPRGKENWREDNPVSAVKEFLKNHPEFVLEKPARPFDESMYREDMTYWPSAWLKKL